MEIATYDYVEVEKKWQNAWLEAKINRAEMKEKKKFFIHFAYPGVSGYLHVGHMRGFSYCDVIARYKRMQGFSVLYPAGFHASGIPSVGFAKKVEREDEPTIALLKQNGCSDEFIKTLVDPTNVVEYFSRIYVDDYWKKFGFLIDYNRVMTTISPGYKKFIEWQFTKLNDMGYLIQKPHFAPFCPECGPVAVDKSETDISQGGNSEVLDFTVVKFKMDDGTILPAATLRPETIFGVTNMWVNPSVVYTKIRVDDEVWICSEECAKKLTYQYEHVRVLDEKIPGEQLIGITATIPSIERKVPLLSGVFADPDIATGIVMSVPAHAPYDWIALVDSGADIEPITIIDVKDLGKCPARQVCEQLGVKDQTDADKLEEATDIVYKKEFHKGSLNDRCGKYAGVRVSEIKDTVRDILISDGLARPMKEFSEPVVCRCKERVVIKRIPDQWFVKYSDGKWTEAAKEQVSSMDIYPIEYKEQLPGVLDWFDDRAAIRSGSWLGTEFPFKKGWTIEPISDSTLYSAYYTISSYVNNGSLNPEDMTLAFFDYVFLGKGKSEDAIWERIRKEFLYWYPLDLNLGGKEHKTVHFPVFILNHTAIMPKELRPKGIFVHWWVTQKGKEKISKSKGGAEPIMAAQVTYGVDAMRLYYCHVGSPFVDIEWNPEIVLKYKQRILSIYNQVISLGQSDGEENSSLDRWLLSMMQRRIERVNASFEHFDLRQAANEIYFEAQKNLQWYRRRGGSHAATLQRYLRSWVRLMVPFTPHLAEELWAMMTEDLQFISDAQYPKKDESLIAIEEEVGEYLLDSVIGDISEIVKVTKIEPKRICLYLSPAWKQELFCDAIRMKEESGSVDVGCLMKKAMADPELRKLGKTVSQFTSKLAGEVKRLNDSDKKRYLAGIDEVSYLKGCIDYLSTLFDCRIDVYSVDDESRDDPADKSRFAIPLRPAIYIE